MAATDPEVKFKVKNNARKMIEVSVMGKHVSVEDLKIKIQEDSTVWPEICRKVHWTKEKKLKSSRHEDKPKILEYLENDVPSYPTPVEFHVSAVTHVTTEEPFRMIMESREFRPPSTEFFWWSFQINDEEIKSAEKRYLQKKCPNLTQEQIESHEPFLDKFTNSPVFQRKSRYGNYKFTFPLTELMELYQEQNCGGEEPVLRVFKTMFYKQEIVYAVLIHSPHDNKRFKELPLLEESRFARYKNGKIIWHAQAISDHIKYEISTSDAGVEVEGILRNVFYVWDHVCLAFYIPMNTQPLKALKVPSGKLSTAITYCELQEINLIASKYSAGNEALKKKACRDDLYKTAVKVVNELKQQVCGSEEEKRYSKKVFKLRGRSSLVYLNG